MIKPCLFLICRPLRLCEFYNPPLTIILLYLILESVVSHVIYGVPESLLLNDPLDLIDLRVILLVYLNPRGVLELSLAADRRV